MTPDDELRAIRELLIREALMLDIGSTLEMVRAVIAIGWRLTHEKKETP